MIALTCSCGHKSQASDESKLAACPKCARIHAVFKNGVSVTYSRINAAYFVMWHSSVLRIIPNKREALEYAESLAPESEPDD